MSTVDVLPRPPSLAPIARGWELVGIHLVDQEGRRLGAEGAQPVLRRRASLLQHGRVAVVLRALPLVAVVEPWRTPEAELPTAITFAEENTVVEIRRTVVRVPTRRRDRTDGRGRCGCGKRVAEAWAAESMCPGLDEPVSRRGWNVIGAAVARQGRAATPTGSVRTKGGGVRGVQRGAGRREVDRGAAGRRQDGGWPGERLHHV